MVRCKFQVTENSSETLRLQPVTGGSPENVKFFTATPAGRLDLHYTNPELTAPFALGTEVFLDLHLAPRPEPEVKAEAATTPGTTAEQPAVPKAPARGGRGRKSKPAP